MTARSDLAESVAASERAIDDLFRPLAPQIAASVRNRAEQGKITHAARRAILRDLDAMLDTVYGAKRGAPSRFENLIVRHTTIVRRKPVAAAVETIETKLDDEPVLKEMMRRG
jgi:hypothetical protein